MQRDADVASTLISSVTIGDHLRRFSMLDGIEFDVISVLSILAFLVWNVALVHLIRLR